ncbi:ATP-grasp domain-containing protein [Geobacillus thermoleovorans]|uniref:ATP-grasp domain-containing protein n=1 Tax=Geobacillus TaxID=129337 RepID=UPI00135ACC70|nr:ATP-grasp domain-containing protein [Geobacillus sp. TFV-3]KAF0994152.1 Alanine--anticapsin ligase [Geobacillus sp. TFV-3]
MNKYIIILGASRYGAEAAFQCGLKPIIVADRYSNIDKEIAQLIEAVFYVRDIAEKIEVLSTVEKIMNLYQTVDLVVSFTELGLETAAYISEKLQLPTNSLETVVNTRNKGLMRQILRKDPELRLDVVSGKASVLPKQFPYSRPAIIKPLDGFGSKEVDYISDQHEWEKWLKRHQNHPHEWILEPYIKGPEYSVETVSCRGTHFILGITEKQTTGKPHFIETGHIVPARLEQQKVKRIKQVVMKALHLLNVQYGPGHIEVKWDVEEDRPVVIEMHTRPGGDFIPYLHQLASGFNQYELGILSYMNQMPADVKPIYKKASLVKFFMFPEGVLRQISLDTEVNREYIQDWAIYYQVGDHINKTVDSYTRSGHVIVCSSTVEECQRLCDNFVDQLKYQIVHD